MLIDHSSYNYRTGVRYLLLTRRHKDGFLSERRVNRISYSRDMFDSILEELNSLAEDGERIYCSASPRDMNNAIRKFRQKQLDSEYDSDPYKFYRHLEDRWISCLMDPTSERKNTKRWLIDIDEEDSINTIRKDFIQANEKSIRMDERNILLHEYNTKNGLHMIVRPFNPLFLELDESRRAIHKNPLMLLRY